jgi:phage/plasmid-associated DNA primase
MELIERIPLIRLHYLNEMSFRTFKANKYHSDKCKNDNERLEQFDRMKSFCQCMIKARGEAKRYYSYSMTTPLSSEGGGGRLYCGNGIQSLPKKIRGFLLRGIATDIDQVNSSPTILRYICYLHNNKKTDLSCPNLDYYIQNKDELRERYNKMDFINAITDCKPLKKATGTLKDYDDEVKRLVNTIVSLDQYKVQINSVPDTKKYNREGSAISRILGYYENEILQVGLDLINKKNIELLAPQFDGFIPYGDHYENKELLQEITDAVENKFNGLKLGWAYKEHDNTIQMPDDYKIPELRDRTLNKELTFCNNDLQATNHIFNNLKDNFKYCQGTLYYKNNHLWIWNKTEIESLLNNYVMNSKIYKTNEKDEIIDYVQNRKNATNIAKNVIDKAVVNKDDDWFSKNIKSSVGKILFTNGYYDFKAECFYDFKHEEFDSSIVFLEQIHYDFTILTEKENEMMETYKEQLFYTPFGKTLGDYYILQIARGLAGDSMKKCLFGIGSGNSGKSLMTSIIKSVCGGYYGAFNANNIAYNKSSNDEAQKMRWVMLLQTKRIIISNEIQSNVEIDGNIIKKISNGGLDDIVARGHGGNETAFTISFLPIIFANDLDQIKPKDDAVVNRVRGINYTKVCVDKKKEDCNEFEMPIDTNLKNTIETLEFKKAFMAILMESYMAFKENGYSETEPIEVEKSTKDAIGNTNSLIEDVLNEFEITNNVEDYVLSSTIESWLKLKHISITKFGLEMNKYAKLNKLDNVYSHPKKIGKKTKQVWLGLKEIIETDETK